MILLYALANIIIMIAVFIKVGKWLSSVWTPKGRLPIILPIIAILCFASIPFIALLSLRFGWSANAYVIWFLFLYGGITTGFWGFILGLRSLRENLKSIRLWLCTIICGPVLLFMGYLLFLFASAP